jgi:hypothetical protein
MKRTANYLAFGLLILMAVPVSAGPPKEGTYELATRTAAAEVTSYLIKFEVKDGAVTGSLVANAEQLGDGTLKDVALDGDMLRFTLKTENGGTLTFEGRVPSEGATEILGSLGNDARLQPAKLAISERTTIGQRPVVKQLQLPEPMKQITTLSQKPLRLQAQLRQTQDEDEKAKLQKEIQELAKSNKTEIPKLYREVVEKFADSPAAADAALSLIRRATLDKPSADQVRQWAGIYAKAAAPYGARYQAESALLLAELLGAKKEFATIAVGYAQQAAEAMGPKANSERQDRVLNALAMAQRNAGDTAAADATDAKLAALQMVLDTEYLARVAAFQPTKYDGRKAKSDRAVVMELFTGAQCPPCVAADLAFDGLEKTYKPSELILIQYHMHIPGPDPLTNPGSEARFAYYRERFKEDVRGTPTTAFNGKPKAGGGGPIGRAETKYKEYRGIIDEILEENAKASVALSATRVGDTINLKADVSNVTEPGDKKKLRFVLVEDTVRYAGGNKLRFHHMVVRDLPGGPEGTALTDTAATKSVSVKLPTIREDLTKYLDDYALTKMPFPKRDRPMAMEHLKAIALVQDDETAEILQATVVDVKNGGSAAVAPAATSR